MRASRDIRRIIKTVELEELRGYQMAVLSLLGKQSPSHEHYKANVATLEAINLEITRRTR